MEINPMNPFKTLFILATSLCLLPDPGYASTLEIQCPAEIKTWEKLEKLPAGFESMLADASHYWVNVTFYSGRPEEKSSLAPDSPQRKYLWTFNANEKIYISCAYNQSKTELFKMLPEGLHSCELVLDNSMQGPLGQGLPVKIICKK